MLAHIIQIALLFAALLLLAACDSPQSNPTENADVEYLTEEIPPCTPVGGSSVDPCEPDAEQFLLTAGGAEFSPDLDDPPSMRDLLNITEGHISHIVLRGTYLPGTVRCTAGNPHRPPSYLSYEEYDYVEHSLTINCYVDVRVGDYLVGKGPPTLTVQRYWYTYWEGDFANIASEEGKTGQEYIEDVRQMLETDEYLGAIAGREVVLFIGPAASVSTEAWEAMAIWDVQRQEDGTVVAVHPDRDLWRHYEPDDYLAHRSKLEMELPALMQAVTTANQARVTEYGGRIGADASLPMLLTDASQLRQYYTNVGAYDHPDGTPVPPPPVPGKGVPVPDIGVDDSTPGPSPTPPGGVEDSTPTPTSTPTPMPPAPQGLSVSLENGTFSRAWSAVTGAARYESQYRISGSEEEWAEVETTEDTSFTFSPDGGPTCGSSYEFRVRAYGDGTTHMAEWGSPSDTVSVTTGACNRNPAFDASSYDFSVSEDAATGSSAGTVSATDPDEGDTVSYSITAGNEDGKFAIGSSGGQVTVAGALDYETTSSYTLMVEASDGNRGKDSASVTVTVVDVAE